VCHSPTLYPPFSSRRLILLDIRIRAPLTASGSSSRRSFLRLSSFFSLLFTHCALVLVRTHPHPLSTSRPHSLLLESSALFRHQYIIGIDS
jgi:hypothetical protein